MNPCKTTAKLPRHTGKFDGSFVQLRRISGRSFTEVSVKLPWPHFDLNEGFCLITAPWNAFKSKSFCLTTTPFRQKLPER